jgi:PiT family inorganic phosphate transporter
MDAQLVVAVLLAIGFAVTNGLHDASNAIATLVATRAATPLQAILLASVFNLLGPLFLGAAVADTIGGIVTVPPDPTWAKLVRTFGVDRGECMADVFG